ncbi:hypothetical protein [Thiocystis violacea]|uniref:hypothetical protein n=1 Tax=Thiocystis violacea TaxID=13725 RepID=UPI001902DA72|nr:hypothetical protein [Thiocystis violacea]MBK1720044.1 hypothetical protein [Thiocystis violacea]
MEFFATSPADWSAQSLQPHLTGPRLSAVCASIDRVLHWDNTRDEGEIYCLWGQFEIRRECIREGVRFTLPTCPNAFAWTRTALEDPAPSGAGVLIHATINRTEHDPDFIASIEAFVEDWRAGLARQAVG